MPQFSAQILENWTCRVFVAAGLPPDQAAIVAHSLTDANLCGHDSHGLLRVPQYLQFLRDGLYRPAAPLHVEHETPAALACDGGWGFGQVQAHRLLDRLQPKARSVGTATGTIRQCGHIGRLGEYAERVTQTGQVLIATVNNDGAGQRVAPPGGTSPRLGTNPLCIGVPTSDAPLILDFGTSVVAEGKVRGYYLDGKKPVPAGWLLDSLGQPSTDSRVLYEPPLGSIRPVGDSHAYKGFGLALALDMLAGGLSGGHTAFPNAPTARGNCVLFIVLSPEHFGGSDHLTQMARTVIDYTRDTPRAPGCDAITLPGDPERAVRAHRAAQGIPIPDEHWARLCEAARALDVEPPIPA